MIMEGRLNLEIAWDGKQITGATVSSTRALHASRVLEGKPAAQVIGMVPLLFSICGRSQTVAAAAALEAARGHEVRVPVERLRELVVAGECAHEHLWRLLLDLPALLGEPQRQDLFIGMRRRFDDLRRRFVSGTAWWEEASDIRDLRSWRVLAGDIADLLAAEVLGMEAERFLRLATTGELEEWLAAGQGLAARLLGRLWSLPLGRSDVPLFSLPEFAALAGELAPGLETSDEFVAAPCSSGGPAETGALAREAGQPLVAAALAGRGNTVGVRILARLAELARLVERMRELSHGGRVPPWLRCVQLRPNTGVAAIETARGVLIHLAALDGGKVSRYRIAAPTEWNFHPDGAFARGLSGAAARDEHEAGRAAALLAHALDPCVAYDVRVGSLAHA